MIRVAILRPNSTICEFQNISESSIKDLMGGFFEKILLDEDSCMLHRRHADLPVNEEAVKLYLLAKEEFLLVQGTVIIAGTLDENSVYDGELHDLDPTMENFLGHLKNVEVLVG